MVQNYLLNYTEMDIDTVYIIMQNDCGMNCSLCNTKHNNKIKISSGVIEYLLRLAHIRPLCNINPIRVVFYGGEPLLKIDLIKDICTKLGFINFKYVIRTDCIGLSQDIVNYINEHNISLEFYSECENTKIIRCREDVLSDNRTLYLIKDINNIIVRTTLCGLNYDINHIFCYLYEKLGKEVQVMFEWLKCNENTKRELYYINEEKFSNTFSVFLSKARNDLISHRFSNKLQAINTDLQAIINPPMELVPRCNEIRKKMNIDLDGNIHVCHSSEAFGTISDSYSKLVNIFDSKYNQAFNFADCSYCKYVRVCQAGCPTDYPCEAKYNLCKIRVLYYQMLEEFLKEVV